MTIKWGVKKLKRLLMLGGASFQVPAIIKARKMGHYVITCDYLVENPGHQYAHEYHNVSTLDKEAVLSLAKSLKVDGIVCYAADSGAPTVAYVAEKLGLPSNPYRSVEILFKKDLFRDFLKNNGFHTPRAKGYYTFEEAKTDFYNFNMPVMVKPVDAAGSRGISKIDSIELLQEKVEYALRFSREKRFIIEEFIEKIGYQVEGDGFSVNGKLVFRSFANNHFTTHAANSFNPIGESWPCNMPKYIQHKMHDELQRLLDLLNMKTGPYNFDIQIDEQENIYILDMGARNGGDLFSQLIKYATGIDIIEYTIKAALGEGCSDLTMVEPKGYWSSYMINSQKSGIFKGVEIDDEIIKNNIVECNLQVNPGERIFPSKGTSKEIGMLVLKYSSMSEMLEKMANMSKSLRVIVE